MDAKFSAKFWTDPRIVDLDKDAKLAAAWMVTNPSVNLAGYAEVSDKVFRFHTEVDTEAMARACHALGKSVSRTASGYWLRNYIRRQLGFGNSLLRNTMCGPLLRDMRTMPGDVVGMVLEEYPELRAKWDRLLAEGSDASSPPPSAKGMPSPADGHAIRQSREERRRAERSRAEQSGAQGGAGGSRGDPDRAVAPAEFGEPLAGRLISLGLLKGRQAGEPWAPAEIKALRTAGLDTLSDADFLAQLAPVRSYYLASIPREKDRRRRSLATLLEHWTGELDAARTWVRENNDGLSRH